MNNNVSANRHKGENYSGGSREGGGGGAGGTIWIKTNILENNSSKVLLNRIDLLGRNFNSHGFYLEIFDDGTVNKKVRLN